MKPIGNQQPWQHCGHVLVRRQRLAPGEATSWRSDPFRRVSVVLKDDLLNIEFQNDRETLPCKATVGEVDWLESDQY